MAKKLTYREKLEIVRSEALTAYSDCWMLDSDASMKTRNLSWKASHGIKPKDAMKIMEVAVPHGYNQFNAEMIGDLPKDCLVFLSREGSVCLYVVKGKEELPSLDADEKDFYNKDVSPTWSNGEPKGSYGRKGEWRYWWD